MSNQPVHFEWQFNESEAAWAGVAAVATPMRRLHPRLGDIDRWLVRRLLSGLLLCAVSLIITSDATLNPREQERIHASIGIQALFAGSAAAPDVSMRSSTKQPAGAWQTLWQALQPPSRTTSPSDIRLLRVEPVAGLVLAEVFVNRLPSNWRLTSPYRETLVYRATDSGWLRTTLDPSFWGEAQQRTTAHFQFEFFARDAAVVEASIPPIEALYPALYQTLGLPEPTNPAPWIIEITPEQTGNQGFYGNRLRVSSPLVEQIPAELSAVDYLTHRIARNLIYQAVNGGSNGQIDVRTFDRWQPVRRGLRSWLQYELLAQRWPWDQEAGMEFYRQVKHWWPLQLTIVTERSEAEATNRSNALWQAALSESIITYAVAAYGRKRLPDLLRGLRRYESWDDLITGVYGVSLAEFEAGWNRHIAGAMQ